MLYVPNLSESLAGRIEILSLAPFSAGELLGTRDRFVDWLFQARGVPALTGRNMPWPELLRRIVVGGYPEVTRRGSAARRHAWFGSYLTTILQRDVRQMADIAGLTELPRLFALLAAQSGGLLNMAELSRDAGISQPTMKRYLTLLQATDLYQPLTAWASNARKRLIKSAKAYLNDTGLLAYLLGLNAGQLAGPTANVGRMLEAFVCQELRKQISWSKSRPTLHYYRTTDGKEVDFVLEHRGGQVVGIEVKASVGLKREDLRGLDDLAETTGRRFRRGIVLYAGAEVIPFSSTIMALPISALWRVG